MTAPATELSTADRAVVDRWWQHFVQHGSLPAELELVQGRLIRAVHRGRLPSGPVHVKTMTFPRQKDRLRYLLRQLPAAHEADMLAATAAAGLRCPEVLAVRTARRRGLPHRSMLVLRTLPLMPDAGGEPAPLRMHDQIELAAQLLAAGLEHRDLHEQNFVRCADGLLAVLDLQSVRPSSAARRGAAPVRLANAARIVRDQHDNDLECALRELRQAGLLRSDREVAEVRARRERDRRRFERSRLHRCLMNSTGFERRLTGLGIEYRVRGELAGGRWWWGPRSLRRAWLGQRARQLAAGGPLPFRAFLSKWWWLGGGAGLYVPGQWSVQQIEAEVRKASAAIFGQPSVGRDDRGRCESGREER